MDNYLSLKDGALGKSIYLSSIIKYLTEYTVTKNGIKREILDFVDITFKGLWKFTTPILTQSIDATIAYGSTGDVYSYVINGSQYTYTQQATDTNVTELVNNIRLYLNGNNVSGGGTIVPATENINATVNGNVITITTTQVGTPFTINNTGTTVKANNYIPLTITVPNPTVLATPTNQFLSPNSVEIIKTDGTLLMTDDGSGVIGDGTVDYVTGKIVINSLDNNDYYVRYNQISNNSFLASKKDVFTYSLPKDTFYTVTEKLSTIEIITN